MTGLRIAILGLGRSGLGVAKAALALGALPHVFDETVAENLSKAELADEAKALEIPVTLGWKGSFNPKELDLIVVNPAVPKTHPKLAEATTQNIEVIGEIEFAYRIAKAPIVAITGTNGKSTTTVMTYLCLQASGVNAVLCGNIFGSGYEEVSLTDAALTSRPDQILVAEISSFQLEWISKFRPVAAGITNIWPDHMDRYESFEEYAATKQKLFQNLGEGDFAVVRANDPVVVPPGGSRSAYRPRGRRLAGDSASQKSGPTVLTFGATGQHARVEERDLQILDIRTPLDSLPFHEPHNYQNACMAALLAYGALKALASRIPNGHAAQLIEQTERQDINNKRPPLGLPPEQQLFLPPTIVQGLKNFHGLAHRMEHLGDRQGILVINNSMCTNPDAVIKSVQAVRDPTHILLGGVNKGLDFGPLKHYLANHRHKAYLFGRDSAELNEMLGGGYPMFATMQEAFKSASENATKGEVIMLAPGCASTDTFRDFRDRGNVFKAIAKDWLLS